jgi:hypothetical protein
VVSHDFPYELIDQLLARTCGECMPYAAAGPATCLSTRSNPRSACSAPTASIEWKACNSRAPAIEQAASGESPRCVNEHVPGGEIAGVETGVVDRDTDSCDELALEAQARASWTSWVGVVPSVRRSSAGIRVSSRQSASICSHMRSTPVAPRNAMACLCAVKIKVAANPHLRPAVEPTRELEPHHYEVFSPSSECRMVEPNRAAGSVPCATRVQRGFALFPDFSRACGTTTSGARDTALATLASVGVFPSSEGVRHGRTDGHTVVRGGEPRRRRPCGRDRHGGRAVG